MAFPTVESVAETSISTGTKDWTVNLPASIQSGDLLIAILGRYSPDFNDRFSSVPSGWTELDTINDDGFIAARAMYRFADGTEGSTLSVTLDGTAADCTGSAQVLRISGVETSGVDSSALSAPQTENFVDPPDFTHPWSASDDVLWIVGTGQADDDGIISSTDGDFTNLINTTSGGGTNSSASVSSSRRELATQTITPGRWTISEVERVVAITIAVQGTAGADTTAPVLTSPTGTATGQTTASGTVSTDEGNGTLDAVVTASATTPSAAQIQAGQDHTGSAAVATDLNNTVTATGSQSVSFTGLTASTTYYVHYVHEDAAANVSTAVTSSSFTTDTVDTTAPTLSSASGTATGQTTADLSVSTNEGNGTLYWVVSTSATPPSVAQIQAGNDSTGSAAADSGNQSVSGTGTQNANATGLAAGTTYYAYFQHTDAASNDSTVASSASFATSAAAVKGIQLSLKEADGTTAAASLTGLYYHAWDALNPAGASDANGSAESTDASGVLEIDIDTFSASIGGEVFLFVYSLDGTEDKDSVCFAGRVPVVDIS